MYSITGEQKGAVYKGIADLFFKVVRKPVKIRRWSRMSTTSTTSGKAVCRSGRSAPPVRRGGEPGNA